MLVAKVLEVKEVDERLSGAIAAKIEHGGKLGA